MAKNLTPGMNDAQAQKDRGGFTIDAVNTTGGKSMGIEELPCGIEVGNPYSNDPLGKEKTGSAYGK